MKSCEVVINFSPDYFEKLRQVIQLENYQIFTDDVTIKQKGNEVNLKINWIEEYFGYANDEIYNIEEKAIEKADQIYKITAQNKYEEIALMDGLKTDVVGRLVFLEEIQAILEKNDNVLFLFSGDLYQSFAVPELAERLNITNKHGVLECKDAEVVPVEFDKRAASTYKHIFSSNENIALYDIPSSIKKFIDEKISDIISKSNTNAKCGFFLTDNAWHLYLNPIYPVLEKFKENNVPFIIFTLDDEATRHLEEKKYQVFNLTPILYELLYKIILKNQNQTRERIEYKINQKYQSQLEGIRKGIYDIEKESRSIHKSITKKFGKNITSPNFDAKMKSGFLNKVTNKTSTNKEAETQTDVSTDINKILLKIEELQHEEIDATPVSFIESAYFWILRHYLPYSKYRIIEVSGKIVKPLFVKIEKRAKEMQKKKQEQMEKEQKRAKEFQKEKEIQFENDIKKLKELKELKEKELDSVQNKKKKKWIELSVNLLSKKIELNEINLRLSREISVELEKTILTIPQKFMFDLFTGIKNNQSKDQIRQIFQNYFANDTNALYLARICGAILLVSKIFEAFKFRNIMMSSGGSPDLDLVCSIAKKYSVLSYTMTIHPYEEHNPIYKVIMNSDKIFVAGKRLQEEFSHLGIAEEKMIIAGNPKFDHFNNILNTNNQKQDNRNLVIVANSRWNDNDEYWISELVKYCNKNQFDVLIKIHPVYKNWKQDLNKEKIKKINDMCSGLKYQISIDADLKTLFPRTAVLITEFSWTGFEASLCDVPLIVTNFFGKEYSKYSLQFDKEGIALHAKNSEELFECMRNITTDRDIQKRLKNAREKLNSGFNYLNDGKSAKRIFDILTT